MASAFYNVNDVKRILECADSHAYKVIRELREEMLRKATFYRQQVKSPRHILMKGCTDVPKSNLRNMPKRMDFIRFG